MTAVKRDSKTVGKLVHVDSAASRRPRMYMKAHARWQKKVAGGMLPDSTAALAASRADRAFGGKPK
ncbi:MAG TPA: hypothetical protein VGR14_02610 [Verrucomicrobiae bacterium]|jgi:hypothetical protein|nr:hypothetical protein [Verrucomicrobiae bacterium]